MSSTFAVRALAPLATHVYRSATTAPMRDRRIAWIVLAAGLVAPATLVTVAHSALLERLVLSLSAYVGLVVVVLSWIGTTARVRAVRGWIAVGVADWVCLQALLNIAWTPLFFGAGQYGLAFAEIVVMWLFIGATVVALSKVTSPPMRSVITAWSPS